MKKDQALIGLGILVIVLPFLGIPAVFKTSALVLLGVGIVIVALMFRQEGLEQQGNNDVYVENEYGKQGTSASHNEETKS